MTNGTLTIPALSLWQPWASAMALGSKRNETRHWPTTHRGLFAVHAAKRWNGELRAAYDANPAFAPVRTVYPDGPPLGCVVALALLTDCLHAGAFRRRSGFLATPEAALGDYGPGRFALLTEAVRPLTTPVPLRGQQRPFFPWKVETGELQRALGVDGEIEANAPLVSADGEMLGCLRCGRTTLAERAGVQVLACAFCPGEAVSPAPSARCVDAGYAYRRSDRRYWYVRFRHGGLVIRRGTGADTEAAATDALRSWKLFYERNRHVRSGESAPLLETPPLDFDGTGSSF